MTTRTTGFRWPKPTIPTTSMTSEVVVTVPKGYTALSNGRLVSETVNTVAEDATEIATKYPSTGCSTRRTSPT
jgi:aminopeptidase N